MKRRNFLKGVLASPFLGLLKPKVDTRRSGTQSMVIDEDLLVRTVNDFPVCQGDMPIHLPYECYGYKKSPLSSAIKEITKA